MLRQFYFFSAIFFLHGCIIKSSGIEYPMDVAKSYCDCIGNSFGKSRDAAVIFSDCANKVFSKSRLMSIYIDFNNREKYNQKTLDSAYNFAVEVRNITDALCYEETVLEKIEESQHN